MKYEPFRLTSMTRRKSSGASRVAGTAEPMPALLISTSTRPNCLTVSSTTWVQSSGIATSALTPTQPRPSASTCARVCSSFSTRRAQIAMSAPASAKPVANATPKPDEAPVTIATFPASEKESRKLLIASAHYHPDLPWSTPGLRTADLAASRWRQDRRALSRSAIKRPRRGREFEQARTGHAQNLVPFLNVPPVGGECSVSAPRRGRVLAHDRSLGHRHQAWKHPGDDLEDPAPTTITSMPGT
jgi:hypothetical protein